MNTFKIDLYTQHSEKKFPAYKSLSREKIQDVLISISEQFEAKGQLLFESLTEILAYQDFDEAYTVDLHIIISVLNFPLDDECHVIWNENDIDVFKTTDLIDIWEDIWFPSSDEAVILYSSKYKRILLITHYGRIHYN